MSEIRVDPQDPNCFHVSGDLDFANVPEVLERGNALFREAAAAIVVDLEGVTRSDSAGVALLIEWMRQAHSRHKNLTIKNIPPQMMSIAKVSGLDRVLPLA